MSDVTGLPVGGSGLAINTSPSIQSLTSDVLGWSPRSTESSGSLPYFVPAAQLGVNASLHGRRRRRSTIFLGLKSYILHLLAVVAVTAYDVLLRLVMTCWYLVDLDKYSSSDEYLHARAEKKTRRYVESATSKLITALAAGQVSVQYKTHLDEGDFAFAGDIFCNKHGKPWLLYAAWKGFATLLAAAPYYTSFTTVVDCHTGATLALFMEFRSNKNIHHFITALVDHTASKQYGLYVAKYDQLISACTQDGVSILRMGPTTDSLKASLGGIRFPLFVVGSPVWAAIQGRCSVVAFGIMTSVGLFAFLMLTQWQMDASGLGRLSTSDLLLLYTCCMAFVKVLPFFSIGIIKVLRNPRKYLLQTSFYAQGVIFGGVLFIAIISLMRRISPLRILDAICMFAFVGDCVGRLGCHWYGCCFGRPIRSDTATFAPDSKAAGEKHGQRTSTPQDVSGNAGNALAGGVASGKIDGVLLGLASAARRTRAAREPSMARGLFADDNTSDDSKASCRLSDDLQADAECHVTRPAAFGRVHSSCADGNSTDTGMEVQRDQTKLPAVMKASNNAGTKGGVAKSSAETEPFHVLSVLYLDRHTSVARLRPDLVTKPLLPTQLLQALFATVCQVAILACVAFFPVVKSGLVGCAVLILYSIGRVVFFFLREDEVFKSNRSYTTAYIAVATGAASALTAAVIHLFYKETTHFRLTWVPGTSDVIAYLSVAIGTAIVNLLIQGLHHHEHIGRFPDLAALFAAPTLNISRKPSTDSLMDGGLSRSSSFARSSMGSSYHARGSSMSGYSYTRSPSMTGCGADPATNTSAGQQQGVTYQRYQLFSNWVATEHVKQA